MTTPVGKRLVIYRGKLFPVYDERIDFYCEPYGIYIAGVQKALCDFIKKEFPNASCEVTGWREEQSRTFRFELRWKRQYTAGIVEIQLGSGEPKITDKFVELEEKIKQ